MSDSAKTVNGGGLEIAGGMLLPANVYPQSLGTSVLHWFGDALGRLTGEIPPGYLNGPYFKQWIRGRHSTADWFSIGPYQPLDGVGTFRIKMFMLAPVNARNAGQNAFYIDVYDYDGGTVLASATFSVADLPSNSDAFAIISVNAHSIVSGHRYETRVRAEGGADLYVYLLHWEVDVL
ncbi:MAG: hypothetical protein SFU86_11425 [Pirellulaceae bacterium]|nr:hypothetical protein [Pirellulaceae bacterium]